MLPDLLAVAVEEADPAEVMPPVDGPAGWTPRRREAFVAWHRARGAGLDGPLREATYAIVHEGRIAGSARLARCADNGAAALETGVWLARSRRGRGIGTAVLRILLDEAAKSGARFVLADTAEHNAAALTALSRNGAIVVRRAEGRVHVRLGVGDHLRAP